MFFAYIIGNQNKARRFEQVDKKKYKRKTHKQAVMSLNFDTISPSESTTNQTW